MTARIRIDGVVVFGDGRTHPVRITPELFLQWCAPKSQMDEAEGALRAMSSALAATFKKEQTDD
ncbi:hypothetical protein [Saccharopolyspora phatthalungensis]|uniref:Uncharacterized protein n=1 Tax=Saccharopolyspora phatthalungensis TaxID=664693 RepID=A0A840Q512_9PSEU|nr:hypothetical protein [Saccharopolyspora phatthalungensis]MBB5154980.1 hypothetical protein [Saccharopolyspora phatthalungensis]